MAEISPFRGIRYNQEIITDMATVICPPYDVISPEEQKDYYEKSDYNVVRLEHGMESPEDAEINNKHSRARDIFNEWLKDGIFQTDAVPAFYIHEHTFSYQDIRKRRLELIAVVRLEPWENKVVLPHENTSSGAKSDRLELMRACTANFSPLLCLYDDPGQRVTKLLTVQTKRNPLIHFTDNGDIHKLWMSNEPEFIQRISHFLAPKSLYIADGHHRYETALAYQAEKQKSTQSTSSDAAFNFIMMTLVSFSDPGLIVAPLHRMVRNIPSQALTEFKNQLETFFRIESFPVNENGLSDVTGATIKVLGLEPGNITGLRLRQSVSLKEVIPEGHSQTYRRLDVSILQHIIMDNLLATSENDIAYTSDIKQAQLKIENGEYQMAFLLNPLPVTTIKSIADANDRMPRKSTYFYPKLPTGLIINRLEGMI